MDAVIAWVDGNDPTHKNNRLAAMEAAGLSQAEPSNATYDTRFDDKGEIYFCIASILKYAPFIDRIYIVTADQTPAHLQDFIDEGLCPPEKIRVVSHSEIFEGYEEYLPTFNSLSIETMLWRIKNLSANFLYFNDDFFFNGPVTKDDFFDADGKLKVCGRERSVNPLLIKLSLRRLRYKMLRKGNLPAHYKTAQATSAMLAGRDRYVQLEHHPHVLNTETMKHYFSQNDAVLRRQIRPKFRDVSQFLPVGLCNHLELQANRAVLRDTRDVLYIKPTNYSETHLVELAQAEKKFACIQSLDEFPHTAISQIRSTLSAKFKGYIPSVIAHNSDA
jgi:hypothetical protein